ncbi:MAG TPA: family 16 glycosylhydrolase [Candidatus Saccharimonadales bacterium]|nr:family 16 glycosylhydrolase [Candidatus Saccharimonadales bacterium]
MKPKNNLRIKLAKKRFNFSIKKALVLALIFGLIGSYFIWKSFAATPEVLVATVEAEQMNLPTGSSVVSDTTASASQAIKLVGASGITAKTVNLPSASDSLDIVTRATSCSGLWPKVSILIDGVIVQTTTVASNTWTTYGPTSKVLPAGNHALSLSFTNQRHGNCYTGLFVDALRFYQPAPTTPMPLGVSGAWNMKFSDEFNGTSLDLTKWRPNWCHWSGCTDTQISKAVNDAHEASCYDPAQVNEKGTGYLNLQAVARSCTPPDYAHTYDYASGLVQSANHYTFTYGYMEARIWTPPPGSLAPINWNSFWTVGSGTWPTTGEIDVMESLGGQYCYHTHYGTTTTPLQAGGCASQSVSGWHTFGANWQPSAVTFYYDGVQVGQVTGPAVPSAPQFLVGQYALSSVISPPITVPSNMLIDYIRVWQ